MIEKHEYKEEDFSENYTVWKGEKRNIPLDGWVFDRFNNAFYKECINKDEVLCVSYTEEYQWHAAFGSDANLLWKYSSSDAADVFLEADKFFKKWYGIE